MDVENDLGREESLSSETEETDTADCCCYVAIPCGCGCDACGPDVEEYCC